MDESHFPELNEKIWPAGANRSDLVRRVTSALREQILSGRLAPETKLIPEAVLAKNLNVSRPTLREAIRIISREGLLDVKHGVGTFVTKEPKPLLNSLDLMRSMTEVIRSGGHEPSVQGFSIDQVPAPHPVAEAMGIPLGTQIGHISRVRVSDGVPFIVTQEYVRLDSARADMKKLKAFDGTSLYEFLKSVYGRPVSHSQIWIEATAADDVTAKALKLKKNAPLLKQRELHFDFNGKPLLFSLNLHNTEVVQLTTIRSGTFS